MKVGAKDCHLFYCREKAAGYCPVSKHCNRCNIRGSCGNCKYYPCDRVYRKDFKYVPWR